MKTQKVEIELPVFDGYEFYKFAKVNDLPAHEIDCAVLCDGMLICSEFIHSKNIEVCIYKRKNPRRIIFEETVVDYVKPGELFMDDFGMPNIWDGKGPSFMQAPKLKKTLDDFEVKK